MTKGSGLGSLFIVGVRDVSGDVGSLTEMGRTQALGDYSSIQTSGTERKGLRLDGSMGYAAFWNGDAGASVDQLSDFGTATQCTFAAPGTTGRYAESIIALRGSFSAANGQDGSLGITGQVMSSAGYGLESGRLLTVGLETIASAGNGAAVDRGVVAATDFGMAAYLHVISLGSGSAGVRVQDSTNGTSGWADVPGVAFTTVTGAITERVASSATENVKPFLRLVTSGTFTNLVCVVNAIAYRQ